MSDKAKVWADAVADLYHCGFLTQPVQLEGVAFSATPTVGSWDNVAYELASRLGGTLWPGSHGVTWVCGGGAPHGILVSTDSLMDIKATQSVLADMGCLPKLPWTRGRLARAAIRWVCEEKTVHAKTDHIMEGIKYQYHSCQPGVYQDAKLYDVSSYYFRLLQWAPSLRVHVTSGLTVDWGPFSDHERGRWRDLLSSVEGDKILRNSLVGCAMGGPGRRPVYVRGEGERFRPDGSERPRWRQGAPAHVRLMQLPGSPYRGVGLVIVRAAYELCAIAAHETESVYSTVDSVCTTNGEIPRVWHDLGLLTRIVGQGEAEIVRRGCWRVGLRSTMIYKEGLDKRRLNRMVRMPVDKPPIPKKLLYHSLVKSSRMR